jgi:hypothetical protein
VGEWESESDKSGRRWDSEASGGVIAHVTQSFVSTNFAELRPENSFAFSLFCDFRLIPALHALFHPSPSSSPLPYAPMANLFKKKAQKPTPEHAIQTLSDTITTLNKRIDFLEFKIKHEEDEARKFVGLKNKRGK